MAGVNKVIILGRLGRDPEISYTPSGKPVSKFTMATSRKKKNGEEITSWHRCVAWDKAAELICKYVGKGQQLYIEGELSYGQYEKDGTTRYTTDILVRNFNFIGGNNQNNNQNQGYQQQPPQQNNYQGNYNQSPPDDDIPF